MINHKSPRVLGAHFYARYGYDEALRQISTNLRGNSPDKDEKFWKQVLAVVEIIHDEEKRMQPLADLEVFEEKPTAH